MENIIFVLSILLGISGSLGKTFDDTVNEIFETNEDAFCDHNKKCVPLYLCSNTTAAVIIDGKGVISIRNTNDRCPYLEVCCDANNQVEDPIIRALLDAKHEGCGYRNTAGVGFQITDNKDNESEFGEFPWMVAVLHKAESDNRKLPTYICGGAMIAPNVVITAAHCLRNFTVDTLIMRAGEWDSQTASELLPHMDRRVKEIIKHENFNPINLANDIALLILEAPFILQPNIGPICLPENGTLTIDTSRCYATGWGKNKFGKKGVYQSILKKIDLPLVPSQKCQEDLRKTRLGRFFKLHKSFLCAGGERGKDVCTGDGGSPLFCPIAGFKDRYYLVGLVSWGVGCGEEAIPATYANVHYLLDWLNVKLIAKGIDFNFYTI